MKYNVFRLGLPPTPAPKAVILKDDLVAVLFCTVNCIDLGAWVVYLVRRIGWYVFANAYGGCQEVCGDEVKMIFFSLVTRFLNGVVLIISFCRLIREFIESLF